MANYSETNVVIKDFKTYWEEKAQKRRKSWVSRVKRYADKHTGIKDAESICSSYKEITAITPYAYVWIFR